MKIIKNEDGNIKKLAWNLGMVFVIIILFILLGIVLAPFVLPVTNRVLDFILGTFHM